MLADMMWDALDVPDCTYAKGCKFADGWEVRATVLAYLDDEALVLKTIARRLEERRARRGAERTRGCGKRFVAIRTQAGEKVAVSFDVDNTLVHTRGRALAIGEAQGQDRTSACRPSTRTSSAPLVPHVLQGRELKIRATVELAKKAAAAGADVYFVTARTQSERDTDDTFVVSRA